MSASLAYDLREPDGWTAKVAIFRQSSEDDAIVLLGDCPRCGHLINVNLPQARLVKVDAGGATQTLTLGQPNGLLDVLLLLRLAVWFFRRGKAPSLVTACCNCEMPHEGRPATQTTGCGAFGNLKVGTQ